MKKIILAFALIPMSFACTRTNDQAESVSPRTTEEQKVSENSQRSTSGAGASVNGPSNATAQPGVETNDYFNFSSDSSYQRGEDPVRRGQAGTEHEDTANVMGEESRSLSGGSTGFHAPEIRPEGGKDQSQITQNTSRNQQETEIISNIQMQLRNDINLSESAHNVKVTSQNGQIYLRGQVQNSAEKAKVEEVAKIVAGNTLVINRIEVKNR